ncbi:MAG: FAD-binding protein [Chloroflexi bacterium]|nr:FAD-binding protein [Chloroflexota bacterium]
MPNQTILQDFIRTHKNVRLCGGGSKSALHGGGEAGAFSMSGFSGMIEYQPEEFTFTAWAGTPLRAVEQTLAQHGQYLPFDPPLAGKGATLGGTIAPGLSGPGRYRFGGLRDFILGVQFVDGLGRVIHGGGKVVKNAAGFDLPKLMVGSLGELGAITALTFKVFPRPPACVSGHFGYPALGAALEALVRLTKLPLELYAVELEPVAAGARLTVRLGGAPHSLPLRRERLRAALDGAEADWLEGEAEAAYWRAWGEFDWLPQGWLLVKVPLTPRRVPALDERLAVYGALRRYSVGANLAWVGWPGGWRELHMLLQELGLSGLAVLGEAALPRMGVQPGEAFERRVRRALDPLEKFSHAA